MRKPRAVPVSENRSAKKQGAIRAVPVASSRPGGYDFCPRFSRTHGVDPYRLTHGAVPGQLAMNGDLEHRDAFIRSQIAAPATRLSTTHPEMVNTMYCGGALTPQIQFLDKERIGRVVQVGASTIIYNTADLKVERTPGNNFNFVSVFSALEVLADQTQHSAKAYVEMLPSHIRTHPDFIRAFTIQFAYADSTRESYWCSFRKMITYFHSLCPPSPGVLEWEYLASIPLEQALQSWLMQRCLEGTAANSVNKWFDSLVFVCKYYNIPREFDTDQTRNMIKACKKVFGKAPKNTFALNRKLLRYLFDFLRAQDLISYRFLLLNFLCANRASEAVKIHRDNVHFHLDHEQRPYVTILIPNTKTQNMALDDGKKLTFHRLRTKPGQPPFMFDPYSIVEYFYNKAHLNGGWLCPFKGATAPLRRRRLYHWFGAMKKAFALWLKATCGLDVDTSNWRFHSIRTSYIGIMRKCGLSWEQIQLRTAHQLDSKCTRNTYFMNALLSEGFDDDFEKLLEENADLQQLFGSTKGCDPNDLSDEYYLSPIDTEDFSRFTNGTVFEAYAEAKPKPPRRSKNRPTVFTNEQRVHNRMNIPSCQNATEEHVPRPTQDAAQPEQQIVLYKPVQTTPTVQPTPREYETVLERKKDAPSDPTRAPSTFPNSTPVSRAQLGNTRECYRTNAVPLANDDRSCAPTPSRSPSDNFSNTKASERYLTPHNRTTADVVGYSPYPIRTPRQRTGEYAYRDPSDFGEDEYMPPCVRPFSPPVSTPKRREKHLLPPRALRFVDQPSPRPPPWLSEPRNLLDQISDLSSEGQPPRRTNQTTPLDVQLKRLDYSE